MNGHVVLPGAEKLRCGDFIGMPVSGDLGMHPPWTPRVEGCVLTLSSDTLNMSDREQNPYSLGQGFYYSSLLHASSVCIATLSTKRLLQKPLDSVNPNRPTLTQHYTTDILVVINSNQRLDRLVTLLPGSLLGSHPIFLLRIP